MILHLFILVFAFMIINVNTKVKIKALQKPNGAIKSVSLLGSSSELKWQQSVDGLLVDLSDEVTAIIGFALEVAFN